MTDNTMEHNTQDGPLAPLTAEEREELGRLWSHVQALRAERLELREAKADVPGRVALSHRIARAEQDFDARIRALWPRLLKDSEERERLVRAVEGLRERIERAKRSCLPVEVASDHERGRAEAFVDALAMLDEAALSSDGGVDRVAFLEKVAEQALEVLRFGSSPENPGPWEDRQFVGYDAVEFRWHVEQPELAAYLREKAAGESPQGDR